jgi:hypothetical protein
VTDAGADLENQRPKGPTERWFTFRQDGAWLTYFSDFQQVEVRGSDSAQRIWLAPTERRARQEPLGSGVGGDGLGDVKIEFEGGLSTERSARLVADGASGENRVLRFSLRAPNVRGPKGTPEKARVQMDIYGNDGIRAIDLSVRARLSPSFQLLSEYPAAFHWLTISEWWNNASWTGEDFPFRLSVNVVKARKSRGEPLHFEVHAQTIDTKTRPARFSTLWSYRNTEVQVPVASWMLLRYELKEGRDEHGSFRMTMIAEGQPERVLFDIRGSTHHPDDPTPDGFAHFNPIKLYTSAAIVDFVRQFGGALEIDWDDFHLRVLKQQPATEAPSWGQRQHANSSALP